ncbi:sialate O-acetylesterase [Oxalobacteraceae bacterium A2-2]
MPHSFTARRALGISLLALLAPMSQAAVRLPAVLSDHMVLQRADKVPVWGWADPGEQVSVRFGGLSRSVKAGKDGRWSVQLDLSKGVAGAAVLNVQGASSSITVNDVLVGEVWLASGQSNMEKPLGEMRGQKPTFNAEAEIAAADYPHIRLFKTARKKAGEPQDDVKGEWVLCSPATVDKIKFSAAAYFFGRRLHQELGAAVGLIDATWGGTRIEPWTPAPVAPAKGVKDAAQLYNGMIAPLAPFALRGVIWYQGESNIIEGDDIAGYTARMEALVGGWRKAWQRDLAFYYVQVAPHLYHVVRHNKVLDPQAAPQLWEAQADALRIPNTGMIGTTDLVDDLDDIHPRDKKNIGLRLANLALAGAYQRKDIEAYGPVFRSLAVQGNEAVLSFDHAAGLAARDNKPLSWFDIAGADGRYYPGSAAIRGDTVVVSSPDVPQPVAVRFAWDEAARPNLVNGAGLPAFPFRSRRAPDGGGPQPKPDAATPRQ